MTRRRAGAGTICEDVLSEVIAEWLAKKLSSQGGVPSFYDNWLNGALRGDRSAVGRDHLRWLESALKPGQRLQPALDAFKTDARMLLPPLGAIMAQGVLEAPQFAGRPMLKSVFDTAIYQQLLEEVQPSTIIEFGTGSGASALWLVHMANRIRRCRLFTCDISRPAAFHDDRIIFIESDLREGIPTRFLPIISSLPRPLLIVEDAHVNVEVVVSWALDHLSAGDYLVVEDSLGKREALRRACEGRASVCVDRRFLDMFGLNGTSCVDSIFTVLPDDRPGLAADRSPSSPSQDHGVRGN